MFSVVFRLFEPRDRLVTGAFLLRFWVLLRVIWFSEWVMSFVNVFSVCLWMCHVAVLLLLEFGLRCIDECKVMMLILLHGCAVSAFSCAYVLMSFCSFHACYIAYSIFCRYDVVSSMCWMLMIYILLCFHLSFLFPPLFISLSHQSTFRLRLLIYF